MRDGARYSGSIVLGLNDALVEMTGLLAGLTLALQSSNLIAVVGLISGIVASMSMAASEYLSVKSERSSKKPLRASMYTGSAYIMTVLLLVMPFFLTANVFVSLSITLFNAILVITLFTLYRSSFTKVPFSRRFLEMIVLSMGIAAISFGIGFVVRTAFGIEI